VRVRLELGCKAQQLRRSSSLKLSIVSRSFIDPTVTLAASSSYGHLDANRESTCPLEAAKPHLYSG
jgi:hypothetical protein